MNNVVAIIQSRLSSTRLPGKVLLQIQNIPVIEHIFNRLKKSKKIKHFVLATSSNPDDNDLEIWARKKGIAIYRGSLDDVLDRYYQTAKLFNADTIVRITGDCPLVDPFIVDLTIDNFFSDQYDLFSVGPKFPDGLDCQVIKFQALEKAWKEARLLSEREHVCPYIEKNPKLFKLGSFNIFPDHENFRLTLDEEEDFKLISHIYKKFFKGNSYFPSESVIEYLNSNPQIASINSKIIRNEGYLKSIKFDDNISNNDL